MKNGTNKQRLEDNLTISYSILKVDDNSYGLNISYKRDEDDDPIHMTRKHLTYTEKTYELASKFTKLLEDDIVALTEYSSEVTLGDALTFLATYGLKPIEDFVKKMKIAAQKMGVKIEHRKPFTNYNVCCSVTPDILSNGTLGYRLRISYSDNSAGLPLSAVSNVNFVDPELFRFSDSFCVSLDDTHYADLRFPNTGIVSEELWGYTIHTIECTAVDKILYYMQKTAKKLGCKLTFVAFSGGPGYYYPNVDLRKYCVG
ncbi:MAG: hypothetical protein IKE91_07725 [Clostridia bacterium]|nr:hypothetical protein [Clostridia bacterium]